jgi:hypothetical protein
MQGVDSVHRPFPKTSREGLGQRREIDEEIACSEVSDRIFLRWEMIERKEEAFEKRFVGVYILGLS